MNRLWDRGETLDRRVERLTVGRDPELDGRLAAWDATASLAHAVMLERIGVIDAESLRALRRELLAIVEEALEGRFAIDEAQEDGHTAIENRLTERLGEAGRKIHTGRSRNDQVIAALRLWGRDKLLEQTAGVLAVAGGLLKLAEEHRETAVPGYTHTRQAMPTTLGHLFAAHAEGLIDDLPWLYAAFRHLDRSPLGSASGFGVPLPLDRRLVADLLAFDSVQTNTLAVQNDRGKSEFLALGAGAAVGLDLGRLASDLILYSSDELGFIRLSPAVTTGSSIMPQKRNPDVLEVIRAAASRLRSRQLEIAAIAGPLTSGYHRDLQLTKEPFLEGMQLLVDMLAGAEAALSGLEIDAERCQAAILPATGATDAVYRKVASGQAFRDAYREIAADLESAAGPDAAEAWRDRNYPGAPGNLALEEARARLASAAGWIEERRARIVTARDRLRLS